MRAGRSESAKHEFEYCRECVQNCPVFPPSGLRCVAVYGADRGVALSGRMKAPCSKFEDCRMLQVPQVKIWV